MKYLHMVDKIPWRKIAVLEPYRGMPPGTLASIAKTGNVPRKWLRRLGLQETAPAPVCPAHGIVHCYDCQTEQPRPLRKPGKPRARRAINLVDPVSAAATILTHARPEYVARLVELLDVERR